MKKELELEEKVRLLEKEVSIIGDDIERVRLDIKEAVDMLRIEVESLKLILKESVPDFQEKFQKVKEIALEEIDPEWLTKK
jgi:hypothetical protein